MLDLQLQQNEKDGYEKDRTNLQLLQLPKIRKKKMAKKADEKKCKDCGFLNVFRPKNRFLHRNL